MTVRRIACGALLAGAGLSVACSSSDTITHVDAGPLADGAFPASGGRSGVDAAADGTAGTAGSSGAAGVRDAGGDASPAEAGEAATGGRDASLVPPDAADASVDSG